MVAQESGSGPEARRSLTTVLEAWRAAERRLAAGDGDRVAIGAEIRALREEYRRLQDGLVQAGPPRPLTAKTNGVDPRA
jgi:hypothetical protein